MCQLLLSLTQLLSRKEMVSASGLWLKVGWRRYYYETDHWTDPDKNSSKGIIWAGFNPMKQSYGANLDTMGQTR